MNMKNCFSIWSRIPEKQREELAKRWSLKQDQYDGKNDQNDKEQKKPE